MVCGHGSDGGSWPDVMRLSAVRAGAGGGWMKWAARTWCCNPWIKLRWYEFWQLVTALRVNNQWLHLLFNIQTNICTAHNIATCVVALRMILIYRASGADKKPQLRYFYDPWSRLELAPTKSKCLTLLDEWLGVGRYWLWCSK